MTSDESIPLVFWFEIISGEVTLAAGTFGVTPPETPFRSEHSPLLQNCPVLHWEQGRPFRRNG